MKKAKSMQRPVALLNYATQPCCYLLKLVTKIGDPFSADGGGRGAKSFGFLDRSHFLNHQRFLVPDFSLLFPIRGHTDLSNSTPVLTLRLPKNLALVLIPVLP